jgi:hypothetical protein
VRGVQAIGTSTSSTISSSHAIRGSTINVVSSGSGANRGIYVNGKNRFSIRDTVVFCSGSGADNVGVQCASADSVVEVKTSTIMGDSTNADQTRHFDINRSAGIIELSSTDLVFNDSGVNSFTTTQEPSNIYFGLIGDPTANRRYYLIPGVIPIGSITNEASSNSFSTTNEFPISINITMIIYTFTISFKGTIGAGVVLTFSIYKNGVVTPLVITLTAGQTTKTITTQSIKFSPGDTMSTTLVTTGNPGTGTFFATVGTY